MKCTIGLAVLFLSSFIETALTASKTVTICPGSGVGAECPVNTTNECQRDNDCPRDKTCCMDNCSLKCVENALWTEKTDCPNRFVPDVGVVCPSGNNTCHKDSDCPGKQKCCADMCDRHCSDPFSLTYTKRVCPAHHVLPECPPKLDYQCDSDKDCPGHLICCLEFCDLVCVVPDIVKHQKASDEAPVIKGKHVKRVNKFTQGTLKMTCVVTAKRKVEVFWLKDWYLRPPHGVHPDFVHVKYQSRDGRKIVSQLRITNVKCEDSGQYICMAKTDRTYSNKIFDVTVYDRRKGYICPQSEM